MAGEQHRRTEVKALTLHQPWASLIAAGDKRIETRSWKPPANLIGQRIGIHASKTHTAINKPAFEELRRAIRTSHGDAWLQQLPRGVVVATAVLSGFFFIREVNRDRVIYQGYGRNPGEVRADPFGDFRPGNWMWMLEDVQELNPPEPARGSRMLWEWKKGE